MELINVSVSDNGDTVSIPYSVNAYELQLVNYYFYGTDTIVNSYNNVITVNGTDYTMTEGNYSQSPSVLAASLTTLLAAESVVVTYDSTVSEKFTFTFTAPFSITVQSGAKGLFGFNSLSYTVTVGTTLTSDYPVHFTNSDYYYINISPSNTYEIQTPGSPAYSYKIANDQPPGALIHHRTYEPLPRISCGRNNLTSITISVYDQNRNLLPINGGNWNFYIAAYRC